jgi:DNA-binding protein HU-beta
MARKAVKKAVKKAPAKKTAKKATRKTAAKAPVVAKKAIKVTAIPGKTITASALLQAVADHTGMKKSEAKVFVENYIDVLKAHILKGVKVKIGDLGMILIRARKARMGRNPQTGEPVKIKASRKLAFRQSSVMKQAVMR